MECDTFNESSHRSMLLSRRYWSCPLMFTRLRGQPPSRRAPNRRLWRRPRHMTLPLTVAVVIHLLDLNGGQDGSPTARRRRPCRNSGGG